MAYDIGPKIGIDGETEYRKAINEMTQNLKTLGTEMGVVTSQFDKNDRSAEALTAQNEVLSKQIDVQREKLAKLNEGLAASAEKYGENDTRTLKWQAAVNTATASLNTMERQLEQNTNELESQGGAFDGLKEKLGSFGEKAGSVMTAAAKGIAAFATAAGAAATAIGGVVTNAAYAADDINTLSKQTGLSTEEIQKFRFASEQIDVSMDTLTGSMSKMTKNMATASKGTGDAYNAFQALGVEITNQDGTLRDRNEVFNEAIGALGAMSNETQRDAYAMQIFGKSAQDLNPLILGGADALAELGDQAQAAGVILSQDALDTLNLVSDAIDTFKATASGAGNLFSVGFAEPIAAAINTVTGYIQRLTSAFSAEGMDGLSAEIGTVLTDMMGLLNQYIPQIIQFGAGIITNLVTGAVSMLPQIAQTAVTVISLLVESLTDALPELIPVAVDAILTVCDTISENLDQMIDAALEITIALADGLITALPKLAEKVPKIVTKIVTTIADNLPAVLGAAVQIIAALGSGLIQSIPALVQNVPQIISAILNCFKTAAGEFLGIGKNIVSGIWDGIVGMASWLADKVRGFVGGIVDGVKGALGIHSPSKVFAGIGGNMAQGLGEGFGAQMKSVAKNMEAAIPAPTVRTQQPDIGSMLSQAVNAVGTAVSGGSGTYRVEIPVIVNGREFSRAVLPDLRAAMKSDPEVVSDT